MFALPGQSLVGRRGARRVVGGLPALVTTTLNPADKAAGVALTNGNLTATVAGATQSGVRSTTSKASGQFHAEFTIVNDADLRIGITNAAYDLGDLVSSQGVLTGSGSILVNGSGATGLNGGPPPVGAIIAIEMDGNNFYLQRNGQARQGPFSPGALGPWFLAMSGSNGSSVTLNTGASAFTITPTSGFTAWG